MKSAICVIAVAACLACESAFAQSPVATSRPADLAHDPRMVLWRQTFFWAVVLFIVFVVAILAILRFTTRFRSYVLRNASSPTSSEDVWAMHKMPEKFEFDDEGPGGEGSAGTGGGK